MAAMLTAWSKPLNELLSPDKIISKNIRLEIYKGDNYTSTVYNDAFAKLQVTVKVRGYKRCIVWQKQYDAKLLSQYPSAANAISQNVVIPNVADRNEHLEVVYTLTYDTKGSVMLLQDGTVVAKGVKTNMLAITI